MVFGRRGGRERGAGLTKSPPSKRLGGRSKHKLGGSRTAGLGRVPLQHEPLNVGQLFVQVLEPSLRLPVLGVPQILLVLADDLTFDALRNSQTEQIFFFFVSVSSFYK